ncbi:MAG: type II secretion system protein [Victivallaceae bacterium]|nr:type II secretion system protein [Victivallaceae bacterium]
MIRRFTLLEVVVAIGIFAVGLGLVLGITSGARLRMERAEREARNRHILTQAVEYYLLVNKGSEATPPEEVFPYPDYTVDVDFDDPVLPDDCSDELNGFRLRAMKVEVFNKEGVSCGAMEVERIMAE